MTTIDRATLEREARKLCEQHRGEGAWDKPGCHRNHWRRIAAEYIQRQRSISTADAMMAVFRFLRIGA
jgi:hypothetical protein